MKIAKRITIAHPPLRLNYVASFAIRSIPHYPDGRRAKYKDKLYSKIIKINKKEIDTSSEPWNVISDILQEASNTIHKT